jgi:hypothetical protein
LGGALDLERTKDTGNIKKLARFSGHFLETKKGRNTFLGDSQEIYFAQV